MLSRLYFNFWTNCSVWKVAHGIFLPLKFLITLKWLETNQDYFFELQPLAVCWSIYFNGHYCYSTLWAPTWVLYHSGKYQCSFQTTTFPSELFLANWESGNKTENLPNILSTYSRRLGKSLPPQWSSHSRRHILILSHDTWVNLFIDPFPNSKYKGIWDRVLVCTLSTTVKCVDKNDRYENSIPQSPGTAIWKKVYSQGWSFNTAYVSYDMEY